MPTRRASVLYFDLAFLRPDVTSSCAGIDLELLGRVPELAPFVYQRDLDSVRPPSTVSSIQAMCLCMLHEREHRGAAETQPGRRPSLPSDLLHSGSRRRLDCV